MLQANKGYQIDDFDTEFFYYAFDHNSSMIPEYISREPEQDFYEKAEKGKMMPRT